MMCHAEGKKASPFDNGVRQDEGIYLTVHDEADSILKAVAQLGYDLSAIKITLLPTPNRLILMLLLITMKKKWKRTWLP